nr:transposase [Furfurilactobacillus milii]
MVKGGDLNGASTAGNLDYKNFRKFTYFKYLITESDVEELHLALVETNVCSEPLVKHLSYMQDHLEYVDNALIYRYSNGPLEGTNNRIKVHKRNGYGYTRFNNFRLRILLTKTIKTKHPIIIR